MNTMFKKIVVPEMFYVRLVDYNPKANKKTFTRFGKRHFVFKLKNKEKLNSPDWIDEVF